MELIRWILHIPINSRSPSLTPSYIPWRYKQKDLRSEIGTSREQHSLLLTLLAFFAVGFVIERIVPLIVRWRSASPRPPSPECCNRAKKNESAKRNCSREKFRARPPSCGNVGATLHSRRTALNRRIKRFKGDLIGTKRPERRDSRLVDTTVVSHPTFLFFFFTLPLEVCFHLVSIPCNCARTMKRDTVNYSGFA